MRREDISWLRVGRRAADEALDFRWRAAARRAEPAPGEPGRGARRSPQAVIRILSYRHGRDAVSRTAAYIAGKADERFVVEGDIELQGAAARVSIIAEWAEDFGRHPRSRDAAHIGLSAPPGSDPAQLRAAVRAFAAETFGPTQRYLLAEHSDTPHPHLHLIIKLRGYDGRQLDPRKADLLRWRERFAALARDEGLELACSSRRVRGLARRSAQPGYRRPAAPAHPAAEPELER